MKNFFSIKKLLLVTSLSTICFVSCNSCGEDNPDSKEDTKLQQKTKSNNSKKYEKPKLVPENKNEKQSLNYQTQQTTNKQTQQPSNKKRSCSNDKTST